MYSSNISFIGSIFLYGTLNIIFNVTNISCKNVGVVSPTLHINLALLSFLVNLFGHYNFIILQLLSLK